MPYRDETTVKKEIVKSINIIIDKYLEQGISINDLIKYFKKENSLTKLMKDLRGNNLTNPGVEFFNSNLEYKNKVRLYLDEVLKDRVAYEKDIKVFFL